MRSNLSQANIGQGIWNSSMRSQGSDCLPLNSHGGGVVGRGASKLPTHQKRHQIWKGLSRKFRLDIMDTEPGGDSGKSNNQTRVHLYTTMRKAYIYALIQHISCPAQQRNGRVWALLWSQGWSSDSTMKRMHFALFPTPVATQCVCETPPPCTPVATPNE